MTETVSPSSLAARSTETLRCVAGLVGERKFSEVSALLEQAMKMDPLNGDLLNAQGYVLTAMGNHLDALKWYRRALKLNPTAAGIWNNLGSAFTRIKYLKSAILCQKKAISLSANEAFIHHNLGLSYSEAGLHGDAIAAFTRALEIDPSFHLARWDRARSFLFLGNYRQGWADYEIRLSTGQLPKRTISGEKWGGGPYAGRRLVLLTEQGFGDTLWVLRYLPMVKALGGELVIECQRALFPLIDSMKIADRVVSAGDSLPPADLYCHLCSLPGLLSPDLPVFSPPAYLAASPERAKKFQPSLQKAEGRLKVGIVWSGSISFGRNDSRALPLQRLLQAIDFPGVQLYSLQKGPPERELAEYAERYSVINIGPELSDFADTAAMVEQLDLIIMTDSAVAHLAGALGKPVWLLLGYSAHWLWLLDRADSPWYPTIRLFRPRVEGDWDYVLDNVATELMQLAEF